MGQFLSRLFAGTAFLLIFAPAWAWADVGVTYHGRLLKPNGEPVDTSNVQFRIQVRTPSPTSCLLFQETHVRNLSETQGVFSVTLNDGTASVGNSEPFTLAEAFQNRGTLNFPSAKCSGDDEYSPNASDGRQLFVSFNDGTFAGWEPLPPQNIAFVPMAIESMTVGGYKPGNLFRVDNGGVPHTFAPWSLANYQKLESLVANTTISGGNASIGGNAAGFTGSLGGDVTGTQSATKVERLQGRNILDVVPSNGQVLTWNHANSRWEPANPAGGTETDPTVEAFAQNPPSADFTTPSGVLTLATVPVSKGGTGATNATDARTNLGLGTAAVKAYGTSAGNLVELDGSGKIPASLFPTSGLNYFSQGGNAFGVPAVLGTTDAQPLHLRAGGTNRLSILNDGSVGIGTSSPSSTLDVSGVIKANSMNVISPGNAGIIAVSGDAGEPAVLMLLEGGSGKWQMKTQPSVYGGALQLVGQMGTNPIAVLEQASPTTPSLYIKNNGNVGIGSTNPTAPLYVTNSGDVTNFIVEAPGISGNSAFELLAPLSTSVTNGKAFSIRVPAETFARSIFYTDGKFGLGGGAATRDVFLSRQGAGVMKISGDGASASGSLVVTGNIGIGTATPQSKLDVSGTIRANEICDETGSNCKDISSGWGAGGDIDGIVTNSGSGLTGGAASGTATLSLVTDGSTVEVNGSNQLQVKDSGITTAKIGNLQVTDAKIAGMAVNKITSGAGLYLTYAPDNTACTPGQVLKWNNSRWECGTDNAFTSPLTTKGDIYIRNATVDTRLPAGADGKVLKADSTQGAGLVWGDAIATDIASLATTGIVQRNGAGSYSTVTVASPLTYTGGTLGLDATGFGDVKLDGNTVSSTMTIGTNSAHDLALETGGTAKMTVLNSGNVGISTTDPTFGTVPSAAVRLLGITGTGIEAVASAGGLILANNRPTATATDVQGMIEFASLNNSTGANRRGVRVISRLEGSGGANGFGANLSFQTKRDNGSLTDSLFIASTGNVGIGTQVPSRNLEVSASDANTGIRVVNTTSSTTRGPNISIRNYVNGNSGSPYLELLNSGGTQASPIAVLNNQMLGSIGFSGGYDTFGGYATGASIVAEAAGNFSNTSTPSRMIFKTAPAGSTSDTERMRIESNGNVGIGTQSPGAKLDVSADSGNIGTRIMNRGTAGSGYPFLSIFQYDSTGLGGAVIGTISRGTESAPMPAQSGDQALYLSAHAGRDTAWNTNKIAEIMMLTTENQSATNGGGQMVFRTTPNGTTSLVDRVTITNDGNVGIGTISPSAKLHVEESSTDTTMIGNTGLRLVNADTTNNNYVAIKFGTKDLAGTTKYGGMIGTQFTSHATNAHAGELFFQTSTGGAAFERMRITAAGNVGIGTSNPSRRLHVNHSVNNDYAMQITNGGGTGHGLYINTGSTGSSSAYPLTVADYAGTNLFYVRGDGAYYHSGAALSTKESKKEIRVFDEDALSLLKDIQVVSYRYKMDSDDRASRIGFLANDEAHVYDERLTNKQRGFATETIVGVMIKAFQDISKEISQIVASLTGQGEQLQRLETTVHTLQGQLQETKAENQELRLRLERLEKSLSPKPSRTTASEP